MAGLDGVSGGRPHLDPGAHPGAPSLAQAPESTSSQRPPSPVQSRTANAGPLQPKAASPGGLRAEPRASTVPNLRTPAQIAAHHQDAWGPVWSQLVPPILREGESLQHVAPDAVTPISAVHQAARCGDHAALMDLKRDHENDFAVAVRSSIDGSGMTPLAHAYRHLVQSGFSEDAQKVVDLFVESATRSNEYYAMGASGELDAVAHYMTVEGDATKPAILREVARGAIGRGDRDTLKLLIQHRQDGLRALIDKFNLKGDRLFKTSPLVQLVEPALLHGQSDLANELVAQFIEHHDALRRSDKALFWDFLELGSHLLGKQQYAAVESLVKRVHAPHDSELTWRNLLKKTQPDADNVRLMFRLGVLDDRRPSDVLLGIQYAIDAQDPSLVSELYAQSNSAGLFRGDPDHVFRYEFLYRAAIAGNADMVKHIAELSGASLTYFVKQHDDGATLLHRAAKLGQAEMVRLLLLHGAKRRTEALRVAEMNGHEEVARMLREARAKNPAPTLGTFVKDLFAK